LCHNRYHFGFSLVELMIVIIIIGILAAVAVPVYSNNVQKAKRAEADAALGSIRNQIDIYEAEYGRNPRQNPASYVIGAIWNSIRPGELTGKYFSDSSYIYYGSPNNKVYKITCEKGDILEFDRTLDQDAVLRDE